MISSTIEHCLAQALADLPEALPPGAEAGMASHWALVQQWTQRVNLTAIDNAAEAAWLHYRDALTALPWLVAGLTLDVGSGGGFPGIPLALARPQWPFLLMEPRRKRASLLQQAAARLGMGRVAVYNGRLQDAPTSACAQVVTRATFSQVAELSHAAAWLQPGGRLIAYRSGASSLARAELHALERVGLHYAQGHPYSLMGHARRLDVWILRQ